MKIGLIGLGIMGKPMAKNLLKAGYDLTVSDLLQASVDEVVACGAKSASSAEIGETCDLVLTMVPNSPQVKAVMLGDDGVAAHMKPGSIFVDMSSINPVASKEIAAVLAEKGIEMLDAPVSGGEPKAIDGTLSFMVGGKKEAFDKVKPVLEAMGASVVMIVACNIQVLSAVRRRGRREHHQARQPEVLTLAKMAGVDPNLVFQAIKGGLAGSTVMNAKAPMMIEGNDKPGFKIDLHIKDLNNALDCAHTVGAPVPMTAAVQEIFQWLHSKGCGQDDHSSIIKYYKMLTGTEEAGLQ